MGIINRLMNIKNRRNDVGYPLNVAKAMRAQKQTTVLSQTNVIEVA
jgi:hypothetical protein